MQNVKSYVKQNKSAIQQIFNSMSKDEDVIEAMKVYQFLQSAFDTQEIKFLKDDKSVFRSEQTSQLMQTLIQQYYKTTNEGQQAKFYMYRVTFQFKQVMDIIKFWLEKDKDIQVMYKGNTEVRSQQIKDQQAELINKQITPKQTIVGNKQITLKQSYVPNEQTTNQHHEQQQKSDSQFIPQLGQIPEIIKKYKEQINKYQKSIQNQQLNQNQINIYKQKMGQLQTKLLFLEERLRNKTVLNSDKVKNNYSKTQNSGQKRKKVQTQLDILTVSPKKARASMSPVKIEGALKSIFQFYAKQLHLTGVKASFQRIEHQSSRINYQKLVHFLKEYKIFPESSKDQKKLQQIYVKSSSNTRDLTFEGFITLIQKLAQIMTPQQNQIRNKGELFKLRIIEQRKKNKVLMNPFHSLQKQDFRIDRASLKYEFKLMPLNGKDSEEMNSELQNRRVIKHQIKQEKQRLEMVKKVRYIRKLQSIDPFHPLVQKNRHLIKQISVLQSQPIVSMNNIQMYRDKTFDMKQMFGIQVDDDMDSNKRSENRRGSLVGNNSYLVKDRVREIQKIQVDKMKVLMSGIIERSNAKLEKLGISATRKININ